MLVSYYQWQAGVSWKSKKCSSRAVGTIFNPKTAQVRNSNRNLNLQVQSDYVRSENRSSCRENVLRAPRYAIQTAIRFRESGTADWHEGKTVNISRTGILFESDLNLAPRTLLEMQIILPNQIADETQANVLCWGPVVRLASIIEETGNSELAAAILRYRFGHE
jgi:hypothetical protein